MSVLSQPHFRCEEAAFAWLEATLWPHGPVCPHCGGMGRIGQIKANPEKRIRLGLKKCGTCKKQFTVKVGTVFEHARIPLHKMLQAVHLMSSSEKGVSAHRLHRILDVQYRSAWFLAHRIRAAMRDGPRAPLGGPDGTPGMSGPVEPDGTLLGREPGKPVQRAVHRRTTVAALADRDVDGVRFPGLLRSRDDSDGREGAEEAFARIGERGHIDVDAVRALPAGRAKACMRRRPRAVQGARENGRTGRGETA